MAAAAVLFLVHGTAGGSAILQNDRGSAGDIRGTTIIVTLLTDEATYKWDLQDESDLARIRTVNRYLDIACDYISRQVSGYGGEAKFINDFYTNSDLIYHVSVDRSMVTTEEYSFNESAIWDVIDDIDVDSLKSKYDADNVVFLAVFNTDEASSAITCTRNWYPGMPNDNEIVFLYYVDYGQVNPPAVYAHEILHTFAAPDLYQTDEDFGITSGNIAALQERFPNDIMLTCSNLETGEYVYDRITNEITELTAKYIGLT